MSVRNVLLVCTFSGLMASAASAGLVASFESPTYSAGQAVPGTDGWSGGSSLNHRILSTDVSIMPNRFVDYPAPANFDLVIDGNQTLAAELGYSFKSVSDPDLTTGATLSWKIAIQGTDGSAGIYLNRDGVAGNGFAGIEALASGDFIFQGGSSIIDQAVTVQQNKVYLVEMIPDFDAGNIQGYVTNLTDAGPRMHLGSATFTTPTTVAQVQGISLLSTVQGPANFTGGASPSGVAYFDSIAITAVPEPGSVMLLGLGSLALLRRRRMN